MKIDHKNEKLAEIWIRGGHLLAVKFSHDYRAADSREVKRLRFLWLEGKEEIGVLPQKTPHINDLT